MSLTEVIVSAVVFATSASCSLQLWVSGMAWMRRAERQREQLVQLDGRVLAVQAQLEQQAGQPMAEDCDAVISSLAGRLDGVEPSGLGLWIRVAAEGAGRRKRWFDPAAYGLCGVALEQEGDAVMGQGHATF